MNLLLLDSIATTAHRAVQGPHQARLTERAIRMRSSRTCASTWIAQFMRTGLKLSISFVLVHDSLPRTPSVHKMNDAALTVLASQPGCIRNLNRKLRSSEPGFTCARPLVEQHHAVIKLTLHDSTFLLFYGHPHALWFSRTSRSCCIHTMLTPLLFSHSE